MFDTSSTDFSISTIQYNNYEFSPQFETNLEKGEGTFYGDTCTRRLRHEKNTNCKCQKFQIFEKRDLLGVLLSTAKTVRTALLFNE